MMAADHPSHGPSCPEVFGSLQPPRLHPGHTHPPPVYPPLKSHPPLGPGLVTRPPTGSARSSYGHFASSTHGHPPCFQGIFIYSGSDTPGRRGSGGAGCLTSGAACSPIPTTVALARSRSRMEACRLVFTSSSCSSFSLSSFGSLSSEIQDLSSSAASGATSSFSQSVDPGRGGIIGSMAGIRVEIFGYASTTTPSPPLHSR